MSSTALATTLSERRARTVARLVDATVVELRRGGYDVVTVRKVARRAGVAPATAYTYFRSKEHLVTEVFARRLAAMPDTHFAPTATTTECVAATLGDLALLVADEPELAAACTVAMLAPDPEVKALRDRIGADMRTRLDRSLGDAADPVTLRALELVVSGALVQAGTGHVQYADLPRTLADVSDRIVGGDA